MSDVRGARRKVHREGPQGVLVPFQEVTLDPSPGRGASELGNPPVLLYDTSGPGADPAVGLPPLREAWNGTSADIGRPCSATAGALQGRPR